MSSRPVLRSVHGVDFSGARLAGAATWVAHAEPFDGGGRLRVLSLHPLAHYARTEEREPALRRLVSMIAASDRSLWGIDFPFGLPVEIFGPDTGWLDQLRLVEGWTAGAPALGVWCVETTRRLYNKLHLRRTTDVDVKTPFDCYHYRIIYQTFHGMRDVLLPLARSRGTAVVPFQYARLPTARRVVVESCPGSTLKRLNLPHQNYKQPAGGPLLPRRRRTRHQILAGLSRHVEIPPPLVSRLMRNPGGDALDAVIAAVGAWHCWRAADHRAIARHPRYPREGHIYC